MKQLTRNYLPIIEAVEVARSREIRTAIKCVTLLVILFSGEPDIVGAVVMWLVI